MLHAYGAKLRNHGRMWHGYARRGRPHAPRAGHARGLATAPGSRVRAAQRRCRARDDDQGAPSQSRAGHDRRRRARPNSHLLRHAFHPGAAAGHRDRADLAHHRTRPDRRRDDLQVHAHRRDGLVPAGRGADRPARRDPDDRNRRVPGWQDRKRAHLLGPGERARADRAPGRRQPAGRRQRDRREAARSATTVERADRARHGTRPGVTVQGRRTTGGVDPASMRPATAWRPAAAVALSASLWGLWWLPLRALADAGLSGPVLNAALYGIASVALLPWAWRRRDRIAA